VNSCPVLLDEDEGKSLFCPGTTGRSEPFCTVFFGKIREACGIEQERGGRLEVFAVTAANSYRDQSGAGTEFYGTGSSSWNDSGVGMATAF
jgi:hypothetical protein